MSPRSILPLIDLVFLTLGVVVAVMTRMQEVTALPVELTQVGTGAAVTRTDQLRVLSVDAEGRLALDGVPVAVDTLAGLEGERIVVRADRRLPTESLLRVMAELYRAGVDVSVEVDERTDATGPS